jgi:uncharacterized membrane protein YhiD involved in acid resistance
LIFFVVLLGSGLLVYFLLDQTSSRRRATPTPPEATASQPAASPGAERPAETQQERESRSFLSELIGTDATVATEAEVASGGVVALRIFLRFLVAALLATLLAYGRQRNKSVMARNPYVAQTQILLAVVAAAMMMVVGDSAARAFGIFAAASLVRFRTNIRDPKETTVLLVCLGIGLAAGVGRLDMAVILTLFILGALWIMEHFQTGQVFRTMEIAVGTRNVDQTHKVLKDIFTSHDFTYEMRALQDGEDQSPGGKIIYVVSFASEVSTDRITEEILAEDGQNITSLEWDQKKSTTYIYR